MPNVDHHAAGTFCWPELYTTDQSGAKVFYVRLLGWELRDIPMGPSAVYTIFTLHGRDAAACYGALPDMAQQGIQPHWIAYVAVESSDDSAAKAKAAGGRVVKEPFDVPGIGRMAVVQDPSGAVVCSWQSRGHAGIGVVQEPGALQWTELSTHATEAAATFYRRVFGWERHGHVFTRGDGKVGGMAPITAEMGPVKPAWVTYFRVQDCNTVSAKAVSLGATIAVPVRSAPTGRSAVLEDPAGARFGIMEPA